MEVRTLTDTSSFSVAERPHKLVKPEVRAVPGTRLTAKTARTMRNTGMVANAHFEQNSKPAGQVDVVGATYFYGDVAGGTVRLN